MKCVKLVGTAKFEIGWKEWKIAGLSSELCDTLVSEFPTLINRKKIATKAPSHKQ
jgi:hypothetical protein